MLLIEKELTACHSIRVSLATRMHLHLYGIDTDDFSVCSLEKQGSTIKESTPLSLDIVPCVPWILIRGRLVAWCVAIEPKMGEHGANYSTGVCVISSRHKWRIHAGCHSTPQATGSYPLLDMMNKRCFCRFVYHTMPL